ncbi:flagellar basal body rod protein FlgB [Thermodesulforhabdus norvegica]|uniref:Flagellar basal body rod protein FlgB n=1 Tax=Thermodesulforhabdus norvegica TaxID=39841 RepID=A0A1I4R6A5_9BACT|nr:flagellar basal body rod protein FlgB [Thermodesulforhabdus norvegica]SFM47844.1 flagellar basal-body rod protein FlgB [Thermodesulforhabdus norvegica]
MKEVTGIFDRTVALMEDRLTLNARRQELIASNIANIDTPGYVARDLSFERVLEEAMEPRISMVTSDEKHIKPPNPEDVIVQSGSDVRVVETGPVDFETEMAKLMKNNVEYQFIVTMLIKKFSLLKMALTEGSR